MTNAVPACSREDMIARAHALAPRLAASAQKTEDSGAPLDEAIAALVDSGLCSIVTPKVYGGLEMGLDVVADVVRILSAACTSTGWVSAFFIASSWRMNFFSEQAQQEVFVDKNYNLMAGTAAPLQHVNKVDGGYRLSGRTSWCSGSSHAEWFMFTGMTETGASGFLVPREDVKIVDNWYIAGMQGTASNDVTIDDALVPEHRVTAMGPVLEGRAPGQLVHANPMYRLPLSAFSMVEMAPVVVGAMRGAADAFLQRVKDRQGTLSMEKAAGKQAAQMRLARVLINTSAAETLFDAMVERVLARSGELLTLQERSEIRLTAAHIIDMCRSTLEDMVRGMGGDSFRLLSPLQRYFRDVSVLALHAFFEYDGAAETYGRLVLGLESSDRLL